MPRSFRPYIPQSVGDLLDQMGFMMLSSPTFLDKTGYFPEQNLETAFYELNEGLQQLRPKLGDELYRRFVEMSDQMRAYFEADPEDKTGDSKKGRALIREMEELIEARARRS
jgi:hypothetical protein